MPSTGQSIVVDPQGLTVTVDITRHIGGATSTPTTYTQEHGTTAHTLPATISSETEFWLTDPGEYTVSVLHNGNEIAGGQPAPGESGTAVRGEVTRGQRWRIVPEVDVEELRTDASLSVGNREAIHPVSDGDIVANRVGTWTSSATTGWQNSSNAIGDASEWYLDLPAGTYALSSTHYAGANRGIFVVELDDGTGTFTTLDTVDGYAASASERARQTVTGLVIAGVGRRRIRVRVTGKNASSSAYYVGMNGLSFERTA